MMTDISEPALVQALAKVKLVVPDAKKVETMTCDVSKEAAVEAVVARLDSWGGVDIMFNNAGIMHADDADAVDTPEKIWDLTQNINVKGVWYGSKHAVLSMRKHKKNKTSVINTASVVALVGSATPQLAYTASKGAVLAMTRELAIVHAKEGFRFNALCPAPLKYYGLSFTTNVLANLVAAHPSFKTGSVMTRPSACVVRSTSPLADSAKLSSKPKQFYFLPAMKVRLLTDRISLSMAA